MKNKLPTTEEFKAMTTALVLQDTHYEKFLEPSEFVESFFGVSPQVAMYVVYKACVSGKIVLKEPPWWEPNDYVLLREDGELIWMSPSLLSECLYPDYPENKEEWKIHSILRPGSRISNRT